MLVAYSHGVEALDQLVAHAILQRGCDACYSDFGVQMKFSVVQDKGDLPP